jgi:predicted RNA-binding Zn ribbon-like protein
MTVTWIEHRFAGGVLALDVANTVVLRCEPGKSFDRFEDAAELPRFAAAASQFRADELSGRELAVVDPVATRMRMIEVREATDRLFRQTAETGEKPVGELPAFLRACAASIEAGEGGPVALETATALSALSLLAPDKVERIRICANCGWLFLDRSRNGSRRWCDMTVCGNRQKAKRHYNRRIGKTEEGRP